MSRVSIKGGANGTGSVSLESPNTDVDYTLNLPANNGTVWTSGNLTLDNLTEGTTNKKILAAVADALNAGTYDAAKCTAFGLGGAALPSMGDPDSQIAGGIYKDAGNYAHSPFYQSQAASVIVMPYSNNTIIQIAFSCDATYSTTAHSNIAYRTQNSGGAWSSWYRVWNSSADGNGGQPPAPKPNDTTTAVGFVNGYATLGRVTPNISGAVYDVFGFSSSGGFLFRQAGIAANYDCININGNCAVIAFYRTV